MFIITCEEEYTYSLAEFEIILENMGGRVDHHHDDYPELVDLRKAIQAWEAVVEGSMEKFFGIGYPGMWYQLGTEMEPIIFSSPENLLHDDQMTGEIQWYLFDFQATGNQILLPAYGSSPLIWIENDNPMFKINTLNK